MAAPWLNQVRGESLEASPSPTTTLYCAAVVALLLGLLSTGLGISALDQGGSKDAALGFGLTIVGWGLWLGIGEVRRWVHRYLVRMRLRPVLADRARYLGGHPELPRARRVGVLLTADALLLDDDRQLVRIPLAALRQALPPDPQTGRQRPWLVARNAYRTPGENPERIVVEFLDDSGTPRRVAVTDLRHTQPEEWNAAMGRQLQAVSCRVTAAPPSVLPVSTRGR